MLMRPSTSSRLSMRKSAVISEPLAPRQGWRSKGILRRHAHQRMNKADAAVGNNSAVIGAVLTQRVRDALKLVPVRTPVVEVQRTADSTHGERSRLVTLRRQNQLGV